MNSVEGAIQNLPLELQSLILESLPLRMMRELARSSRERRPAFVARLTERERVVAELLSSHFTDEFRQLLPAAQTALPNDLVVKPPVRKKTRRTALLDLACNCCGKAGGF
jgi:hypothetical protein